MTRGHLIMLLALGGCATLKPTYDDTVVDPPAEEDSQPAEPDSDSPVVDSPIAEPEPDPFADSDGDGLTDEQEGLFDPGGPPDTDGDGLPDYFDVDSDDDGILDRADGSGDVDGDGIPNWRDPRNDGEPAPVRFVQVSTEFNQPIGIDYHAPSGTVVVSVHYPTGDPHTLELIASDGSHQAFSTLSGLTDEVKIATVRERNVGGFVAGDLFVGNGVDGQIVRITDDGATVINPWVDLPGDGNGLLRGGLYVDRTGVFGGDLVVVTTGGEVWRVTSAGVPTLLTDLDVHLEGVVTVPDAPARYGPLLAGTILAGAEGQSLMHVISPDGSTESVSVGVAIEDIDLVSHEENFFGVNFGTSRLIGAVADDFAGMVGDILLTQESHSGVGLYVLRWDGADLVTTELTAEPGSATLGQWEHVSFAAAGIVEIPG